jgi:hypothetical protein
MLPANAVTTLTNGDHRRTNDAADGGENTQIDQHDHSFSPRLGMGQVAPSCRDHLLIKLNEKA